MAGRPRVEVDEAWLRRQCSKDYRDSQIAQLFEEQFGQPISARLISTRRKELGLLRRAKDDDEILKKITDWRDAPHGDNGAQQGVRLMRSHLLLAHSMRIGLNRLARLHHRLYSLEEIARRRGRGKTSRRPWDVPYPGYLVHIDYHLKLVHWGIYLAGAVDAFTGAIVGGFVTISKDSITALEGFLPVFQEHGLWDCLRTDYGGENNFLHALFGRFDKGSLLGKSVHNIPIERHWSFLRPHLVDHFRAQLARLAREHNLNPEDAVTRGCVQRLFVPLISAAYQQWRQAWNLGKPGKGSKYTRIGMLEYRKPKHLRPTADLQELTAEQLIQDIILRRPHKRIPTQRAMYDPATPEHRAAINLELEEIRTSPMAADGRQEDLIPLLLLHDIARTTEADNANVIPHPLAENHEEEQDAGLYSSDDDAHNDDAQHDLAAGSDAEAGEVDEAANVVPYIDVEYIPTDGDAVVSD
jgi:hypothetical protein